MFDTPVHEVIDKVRVLLQMNSRPMSRSPMGWGSFRGHSLACNLLTCFGQHALAPEFVDCLGEFAFVLDLFGRCGALAIDGRLSELSRREATIRHHVVSSEHGEMGVAQARHVPKRLDVVRDRRRCRSGGGDFLVATMYTRAGPGHVQAHFGGHVCQRTGAAPESDQAGSAATLGRPPRAQSDRMNVTFRITLYPVTLPLSIVTS